MLKITRRMARHLQRGGWTRGGSARRRRHRSRLLPARRGGGSRGARPGVVAGHRGGLHGQRLPLRSRLARPDPGRRARLRGARGARAADRQQRRERRPARHGREDARARRARRARRSVPEGRRPVRGPRRTASSRHRRSSSSTGPEPSATTGRRTLPTPIRRSRHAGSATRSTPSSTTPTSPLPSSAPSGCSIKWRIELLWWEGCPSRADAAALLTGVLEELGRHEVVVVEREVRTPADAAALGFPGSPTFQVGSADLFPSDAVPSLGCRVYRTDDDRPAPLPDREQLAEVIRTRLARPWDLPGWVDPRRPEDR